MKKDLVVLYIRISIADGDIAEKGESNSVANQKLLLHQYLDAHPDLADYPRFEAVDDGFSGTNGNRPMLQKVLSMAEQGDVKAIIVKDMSRFFRNYYESAKYLDMNFPTWNVRFLSVTESYDSIDFQGDTGGIEQGLKHIMNAYYPKMLSKATTTAQVQLKKQGKFIACQPPYGYKKHSTEMYKLEIDKEAALIVRRIFNLALEGKKVTEIVRIFNDELVECPVKYLHRKFPNNKKFARGEFDVVWSRETITHILTNYTYTGALVSRKSKVVEVGNPKTVPCEPIIVEGTHKGIITLEEFQQVQPMLRKSKSSKKRNLKHNYPLRSLLRCGHCDKALQRINGGKNGFYFLCKSPQIRSDTLCPVNLHYPEAHLEEIVFEKLKEHCSKEEEVSFPAQEERNQISKYDLSLELKYLQAKIKDLKFKKRNDYEKYTESKLTKEEFFEMKQQADSLIVQLEQEVLSKENQEAEIISVHQYENGSLGQDKERQNTFDILTEELTQRYVKAVYIYDMNRIEVEFRSK